VDGQAEIIDSICDHGCVPLCQNVVPDDIVLFGDQEPGFGFALGVSEGKFPGLETLRKGAAKNWNDTLHSFSRLWRTDLNPRRAGKLGLDGADNTKYEDDQQEREE
jgi:hypothetical protein